MRRTFPILLLLAVFATATVSSCTRASKNCKTSQKRMKKNNVGWQN